jgi:hypothetical protein
LRGALHTEQAVNEAVTGVLNATRAVRNTGGLPSPTLRPEAPVRRSQASGSRGRAFETAGASTTADTGRRTRRADYLAAPTDTVTDATFSPFAFVKVAVCRMSSDDAPIFTV